MNKKIVFVQPMLTLKERYGTLGRLGYVEPPIGLCYLAAIAREKCFEAHIIDAQALNLSLEETLEHIFLFLPSIVCITAVSQLIINAGRLADEIKKRDKRITVILGGCHISALPRETMLENPCFDIGVLGEGEESLAELLDSFQREKNITDIKGLIIRENSSLITTQTRDKIKDLDRLPFPALDLLPRLDKYYRVCIQSQQDKPTISLNTSRGCSSCCSFCDSSVHGNQLRYHSAEYVFHLLKHCVNVYHTNSFFFNDSNFFLPFARFKRLVGLLKDEGLIIKWACMARVDSVNEEILGLAKSSGCQQILYGIESGSPAMLGMYNKAITLEQIKSTLSLTKKSGIQTKGFFIFGGPGETKKTIEESMRFMNEIDLDDVGISVFVPFPGSPSYGTIREFGAFDKDWHNMNTYLPVFVPKGFTGQEISDYVKKAYRRFYFRPRIIFSYFKRCNSLSQIMGFMSASFLLAWYVVFERAEPLEKEA